MSPERASLRVLIDRARRAQIAAENEHLDLCAGCSMPYSDWTPGCRACWHRHRNYVRRPQGNRQAFRDVAPRPVELEAVLWRRVAEFTERLNGERLRFPYGGGILSTAGRKRWMA